jgi:hypothetical protein
LFFSPLGSRGNKFLLSSSLSGVSSLILFPLFSTGGIDTGGVDTGGKFAAGFVDTGGKFATGVNNTRGTGGKICRRWWQNLPPVSLIPVANLPPVSLTPVANLPPVSLTPVVHLDLRISPRIIEKIRNDPNVIILG